jgi:hypothetical protein
MYGSLRTVPVQLPLSPSSTSYIASLCTRGCWLRALGRLDGFVFTAVIGENSRALRARIAEKLAWLGAAIDHAANASGKPKISTARSRVALYVVPTDEELMIARHTLAVLSKSQAADSVWNGADLARKIGSASG